MAAVRVVIVDDEYLVRSGLRLILDGAADLDVVGEGATGREAIELVTDLNPDVVCMDIRMPVMDGIAATRALDTSRTAVLILTAFDTEDFILDALDAGASGFLLKDTPPPDLVDAVRRAAAGEHRFSPAVLARLVTLAGGQRRSASMRAQDRTATLTERELDVARAVAAGLTNGQIARDLHLSLPTVKTHLGHIFDKLQTTNRVQVALMVHEAGLVAPTPPIR